MGEIRELKDNGKLLPGHKGDDFFHRAWSPKAKAKKRAARKLKRQSKRRNRRK